MSIILGINAYHPAASAALIIDGVPVVAIAEERLNRVKNYSGFPKLAIDQCLSISGVSWPDVNAVSIARDTRSNILPKSLYALRHPDFTNNFRSIVKRRSHLRQVTDLIASTFDLDPASLRFSTHYVEHHIAHTASAYFASPWESAAGLTVDGSGDFVTCLLSRCEGNNIVAQQKIFSPHSLGNFYTAICQFIGFDKYGDEGMVMGLAPLGQDAYSGLMKKMLDYTDGKITANEKYLSPIGLSEGMHTDESGNVSLERHYSKQLCRDLGEPRISGEVITERDKNLACSLQTHFEAIYLELVGRASRLNQSDKLVLAGGCALNSVANGKIFQSTSIRDTFIQPAAGDDGLALGSALYVSNSIFREGQRWVMENSYLGPEFSDREVESALDLVDVRPRKMARDELLKTTAKFLSEGKIVGWFQGRMEWGPRALGNRSILAHPGLPQMKGLLNSRIKNRESFRPFAPSVLAEHQSDIFDEAYPSPNMLHVYGIRASWRDRLPAVNHVDNTGRIQTVSKTENSLYYDLIHRFWSLTGIPVLLNTSFNENEPIVCSPHDAINCFLRANIDVLVIGSFVCERDKV